ncbi:MAG: glycosyl hydrolase family 2 [Bacteroidales bacterium]|nr:glycosyl hydrolase family 2 [Bacteroidales bacterium]
MRHQKIIIQQYKITEGQGLKDKILLNDTKQLEAGAKLQALMAYGDKGRVLDLTGEVNPDGTLKNMPAKGNWTLYAAFCGKTLQKVKRAAPGGEGYTLDHFSVPAFDRYLSRFDSAFKDNQPRIRCLFNDSYEVYNASWTPGFFEQFLTRRGYDLKKYIRELNGDGEPEVTARVKYDYRLTMSEMLLDHFTAGWTHWAHDHKMMTKNQAHGSPANLLDLYSTVDIPEIETYGVSHFPIPGLRYDTAFRRMADHDPLFLRLASSAAHTSGKKLVSCESFTWLGEHFRVALSQCKPEVEQAFLSGVNHVFYHGTTYSPMDASWPGWLFYASVNFAPSNSFWPHIGGLNNYIARCQSILQTGRPDNDILVYWPVHDRWQQAENLEMMVAIHDGKSWVNLPQVRKLTSKGYTFDFISDKQILQTKASMGNLLTTPEGSPYKAVFIPSCRYLPLKTLEKVLELAENGADVIMEKLPEGVPGLFQHEKKDKELKKMLKKIASAAPVDGIISVSHGKGRVVICKDIEKALGHLGIMRETLVDKGLKFIRRHTDDGLYYYLVNHTPHAVDTMIAVNARAEAFLLMDPLSGEWGKILTQEKGNTSLFRLKLLPGETCFLLAGSKIEPGIPEWHYYRKSGKEIIVRGPWKLEFVNGDPALPARIELEGLSPWTGLNLPEADAFSGTAVYSAKFIVQENDADEFMLVMDNVHESARVWINGKDAGYIWSVPCNANVGAFINEGVNTMRIEVANLMANRIREMDRKGIEWKKFYDINIVNLNYKPFNAANWRVLHSGLAGPVKLVPLKYH